MKKYRKSKRYYYFRKQKLSGLALILIGLLTIPIEWDITAALFLVPVGIGIMTTKDMIIMDDYYWEKHQKIERDWS